MSDTPEPLCPKHYNPIGPDGRCIQCDLKAETNNSDKEQSALSSACKLPIEVSAKYEYPALGPNSIVPITIVIDKISEHGYQLEKLQYSQRVNSSKIDLEFNLEQPNHQLIIVTDVESTNTTVESLYLVIYVDLLLQKNNTSRVFTGKFNVILSKNPNISSNTDINIQSIENKGSDNTDIDFAGVKSVNIGKLENIVADGTKLNFKNQNTEQSKHKMITDEFILKPKLETSSDSTKVKQTDVTIIKLNQQQQPTEYYYFKLISTQQNELSFGSGWDRNKLPDIDVQTGIDGHDYCQATGINKNTLSRHGFYLNALSNGFSVNNAGGKNIYIGVNGQWKSLKSTEQVIDHTVAVKFNGDIYILYEIQQHTNLLIKRTLPIRYQGFLPPNKSAFKLTSDTIKDLNYQPAIEQGGILWLTQSFSYQPLDINFDLTENGFLIKTKKQQSYQIGSGEPICLKLTTDGCILA